MMFVSVEYQRSVPQEEPSKETLCGVVYEVEVEVFLAHPWQTDDRLPPTQGMQLFHPEASRLHSSSLDSLLSSAEEGTIVGPY